MAFFRRIQIAHPASNKRLFLEGGIPNGDADALRFLDGDTNLLRVDRFAGKTTSTGSNVTSNGERVIIATAALTVTLSAADVAVVGREIFILNNSAGTVTITPASGTTETGSLAAGAAAHLISNGTNWYAV